MIFCGLSPILAHHFSLPTNPATVFYSRSTRCLQCGLQEFVPMAVALRRSILYLVRTMRTGVYRYSHPLPESIVAHPACRVNSPRRYRHAQPAPSGKPLPSRTTAQSKANAMQKSLVHLHSGFAFCLDRLFRRDIVCPDLALHPPEEGLSY